MEFTKLNPPERSRTYVFTGGETLEFRGVVAIRVSESGHHRLELADGKKVIVAPRWMAIELDVDAWTF
jgi:hypothetical protein